MHLRKLYNFVSEVAIKYTYLKQVGWIDLAAGCCEFRHETSVSIKCGEFREKLRPSSLSGRTLILGNNLLVSYEECSGARGGAVG